MPFIPSALSLDRKWTAGVPKSWPGVGAYLREHTGHDFPVLSRLTQARAIRAKQLFEKPYWSIERARLGDSRKVPLEVVVNGRPVARREVEADGKLRDVEIEVPIE